MSKWRTGSFNSGYPPKRKPRKTRVAFYHGDVLLSPMSEAIALSLDASDEIKYIGKAVGYTYITMRRRVIRLPEKPEYFSLKKTIRIKTGGSDWYSSTLTIPIKDLALIKRGDVYARAFNKATRYVPAHLQRVKSTITTVLANARENTDDYLSALPLHKKLELFSKFTPEEKQIYDFIYKDVKEILYSKEDNPNESA